MDTKTRKSEALELLALDTPDINQRNRLLKLTALAAGYSVTSDDPGYLLLDQDGREVSGVGHGTEGYAWEDAPDFLNSVDACYKLPLPPGQRWTTASPVSGSEYILAWAFIGGGFATTTEIMHRSTTLPLAMLLAWWQIQD